MKVSSLKPKTLFGSRLVLLRREQNLSQSAFAKQFSEFSGRKSELTTTSVSLWEQGERFPDMATVVAISKFFNVTIDFLMGYGPRDEQEEKTAVSDLPLDMKDFIFRIDFKSLRKYDGFPVFVVFLSFDYENQWGILDIDSYSIIFKDMTLKISNLAAEYYTYPRPCDVHASVFNAYSFNLKRLLKADKFWVELKNPSKELRLHYSGWWQHNETKTCIINPANGLTLPYEGLGVSYNAFNEPV